MRIVGGRWRGRALAAPTGRGVTRPTTDRMREALASMVLAECGLDLAGASVLDLFAGSGALGLELLSRGAKHLTLVDVNRAAAACIRRNVSRLEVGPEEASVMVGDAFRVVAHPLVGAPFSVVVLDPPYSTDPKAVASLVDRLAASRQLVGDALVAYERDADALGIDADLAPKGRLIRTIRQGAGACDLLRIS